MVSTTMLEFRMNALAVHGDERTNRAGNQDFHAFCIRIQSTLQHHLRFACARAASDEECSGFWCHIGILARETFLHSRENFLLLRRPDSGRCFTASLRCPAVSRQLAFLFRTGLRKELCNRPDACRECKATATANTPKS